MTVPHTVGPAAGGRRPPNAVAGTCPETVPASRQIRIWGGSGQVGGPRAPGFVPASRQIRTEAVDGDVLGGLGAIVVD